LWAKKELQGDQLPFNSHSSLPPANLD
jgi:hypothetical protein